VAVLAGGLGEDPGAQYVGDDEGERIEQASIDVRLGGEVDDRVDLAGQVVDHLAVGDVPADETVAGGSLQLGQVGRVAGIGQLVQDDDLDLGPGPAEQLDEVASDEPGGSRDKQAPQLALGQVISGHAVQS